MRSPQRRHLLWTLPVAAYAIFLWRSPYGLLHFSLGIVEWVVATAGLGAWVLVRRIRGEPWPATRLDRPLLAWLLVTAAMTPFSVNLRGSVESTWATLISILILYLMVDATRRGWGSALWRSLYLLTSVVFLMGTLELLTWYTGLPLVPAIRGGWLTIGGIGNPIPPTLHRISFALINATALSGFVALVIPPVLCALPVTKDRDLRIVLLLWLCAAGVILFFALSRGGFLALGVSLVVIVLGGVRSPQFGRWWQKLPRGTSRALLIVMISGTLIVGVAGGFLLVSQLTAHRSGDTVRLNLWRSALEMFIDHPLTGVGPSAYGTALREYRNPLLSRDQLNEAHNVYLEVGAEMGIPGLVVGGWLLLALVQAWWKRWRAESPDSPGWWRTLGVGAALVGLGARWLVDGFVDSAIILTSLLFVSYLLTPRPQRKPSHRPAQWKWAVAAVLLGLFTLGWTWDTWADVHFNRGLALTREGKVNEALSAVERARQIDPWMPLYACHAGYLHGLQAAEGNQDALSSALDHYQACVQRIPTGWVDQLNRAALIWQTGRHADARSAVERATADTPLEWVVWLNRGYWAEVEDDRDDSVSSYGWVLSHDPQLASSPFWHQGGRPAMWNDILTAGEEALVSQGWSPEALTRWRWQVVISHGEWETGVELIEAWLETHPNDGEAMVWLAEALLGLNRPEEANSWLERATTTDPHSYVVRGEADLTLERYEEAETYFRTALFLESNPRAHLGLARIYRASGDVEQAMEEYSRAVQPASVLHTYELVLYRRAGWSPLLPQVTQIRYRQHSEAALEWGAMLEREGEYDLAHRVYEIALQVDPFCDELHQRMD